MLRPTEDRRECWILRDASILSWEVIRRERYNYGVNGAIFSIWICNVERKESEVAQHVHGL